MSDHKGYAQTMREWHRRSGRQFAWRQTADPYAVLIAEMLLQRTRGENVEPVYVKFLKRWPTAEHLARARLATIERVVEPLGLRKRAPILSRLGKALAGRSVPTDPVALQTLPGVGPYTAHAVAAFAGGADAPLVDWVIARVLRRYFGLPGGKRPNADPELWKLAAGLADLGDARQIWLGTLDFAAEICRPRPLCPACPLLDGCVHGQSEVGGPGRPTMPE